MAELHRIYNGKAKGFGFFVDPEAAVAGKRWPEGIDAPNSLSAFRIAWSNCWPGRPSSFPFSVNSGPRCWVKQLVEHALDEQGVLLIAKYKPWGRLSDGWPCWRARESVTVSGGGLELRHPVSGHRQAQPGGSHRSSPNGRPSRSPRRYITFSSKRVGRKLGISSWICWVPERPWTPRCRIRGLLQAVDIIVTAIAQSQAERNDYKKQVFKYCTEQARCRRGIGIGELSAELSSKAERGRPRFLQLHRPGIRAGGAFQRTGPPCAG